MRAFPERRAALVGAPLVLAAAAGALLLPATGAAYLDEAPAGHTGGFGEPGCHACHQGGELDDAAGSLTLTFPPTWEPETVYEIGVLLRHPALERGGFQLAVRFARGAKAGRQAGELVAGRRSEVVEWREVQYARHTVEGGEPEESGEISWALRWRSPATAESPVVFHLAANAANYDDSELGDLVYLERVESLPRGGSAAADEARGGRRARPAGWPRSDSGAVW